MSFQSRIDAYKRGDGMRGAARDKKNLRSWSDRAERNSNTWRQPSDGPMKLPDTGGEVALHDTAERPAADPYKVARSDLNHDDSSPYLRGIRRNT